MTERDLEWGKLRLVAGNDVPKANMRLMELIERDTSRKPTHLRRGTIGFLHGDCPNCEKHVHDGYTFCPWCAQRLDWE